MNFRMLLVVDIISQHIYVFNNQNGKKHTIYGKNVMQFDINRYI